MTEAGPSTAWAWVEGGNGKTVLDAKKWQQLFPGRNKPSQIGQWLHFESDCVRRRRLPWAPLTLALVGEKLTDVGSFTLLFCLCPFRSRLEHRYSHGAFHLALGLVVQSPPASLFLNIWEAFSPKTSELQCRKPDVERSYNSFSSIKLVQVAGSQIEVNNFSNSGLSSSDFEKLSPIAVAGLLHSAHAMFWAFSSAMRVLQSGSALGPLFPFLL